jgi:transcriptional regulator with XRE-family HTH domain
MARRERKINGELLRTLREDLWWCQRELAEAAGVGRATVQRLEQEKGSPSRATLNALAKALNVHPDDLLKGDEPHAPKLREYSEATRYGRWSLGNATHGISRAAEYVS